MGKQCWPRDELLFHKAFSSYFTVCSLYIKSVLTDKMILTLDEVTVEFMDQFRVFCDARLFCVNCPIIGNGFPLFVFGDMKTNLAD